MTFEAQIDVLHGIAAAHDGVVTVCGEGTDGHHAYLMLIRANAIEAGRLVVDLLPWVMSTRLVLDVAPWKGEWFVSLKASPCPERLGVAEQESEVSP